MVKVQIHVRYIHHHVALRLAVRPTGRKLLGPELARTCPPIPDEL